MRASPWLRLAPVALAALLVLPAGAPAAGAAAPADAWSGDPRVVSAWPDGGGFVVRSTRDSALASDEVAADYDAQAALLSVSFTAVEPRAAALSLGLAVQAITEFRDSDGDGRLGLGEPVVRRVEVPGTPATSDVRAMPGGGWRAVTTHTLPAAPAAGLAASSGTTRLEVALEARPAAQEGRDPTRLDLVLRVLDGWARNGTHLAVEAALGSTAAPVDVNADAARLRAGEHALAATWQDGRGSVVEGTDERSMTFVRAQPAAEAVSFPAAVVASWSPAAADGPAPPGGDALLYVGAALVAAAAFVVPAWRRLRSA